MIHIIVSLILTAIVSIGTVFLKDGSANLGWRIIHDHGVFPYIVIFFACWSLSTSIYSKWKSNRLEYMPALWGIFGFLWEQSRVFSDTMNFLSGCLEISDFGLKVFFNETIRSFSVPSELLLLGTGLTLVLLTISTCLPLMIIQKEK